MSLSPDIKYLRVRHTGKTEGSLHLSDLDTEENKNESYKIPVYVPENGSVDLPLNDQVLLSFSQGSIRGHIDEGRIDGHVVSDDGSAEVWVGPDGDDENPGTRSAPFATVQAGLEALKGKYPPLKPKIVRLEGRVSLGGTCVINEDNLHITGADGDIPLIDIGSLGESDGDLFPFIITSLDDESVAQWINEGGPAVQVTGPFEDRVYSYTGEPLDRTKYNLNSEYLDGDTLEGASISSIYTQWYPVSDDKPVITVAGPPNEAGEATVERVSLKNLYLRNFSPEADVGILLKNAMNCNVSAYFITNSGLSMVVDNSESIEIGPAEARSGLRLTKGGFLNIGAFQSFANPDYDLDVGWLILSINPGSGRIGRIFSSSEKAIRFLDSPQGSHFTPDLGGKLSGSIQFGRDNRPIPLSNVGSYTEDIFIIEDSVQFFVNGGGLPGLEKSSDGDMSIKGTSINGNLDISGGTMNVLVGLEVHGNFTVSNSSAVDLTGVHVLGDVDLTNADPANFSWKGGSFYGTLTDPQNIMGGAAAGDYLNIG